MTPPIDEAEVEPIKLASAYEKCLMCWGTGKTPRYRGPTLEGPCIACGGLTMVDRRAHLERER